MLVSYHNNRCCKTLWFKIIFEVKSGTKWNTQAASSLSQFKWLSLMFTSAHLLSWQLLKELEQIKVLVCSRTFFIFGALQFVVQYVHATYINCHPSASKRWRVLCPGVITGGEDSWSDWVRSACCNSSLLALTQSRQSDRQFVLWVRKTAKNPRDGEVQDVCWLSCKCKHISSWGPMLKKTEPFHSSQHFKMSL